MKNTKILAVASILRPRPYIPGFTLVELIVVITILVILGTIAFINLGGFQSSARDSRRISDMANISQAIELAIVAQGSAPIPTDAHSYTGGSVTIQMGTVTNTTVPRMSGDFTDPMTKAPYNYSVFSRSSYYQLGIELENPLSIDTGIPGIGTVYADAGARYSKLSGNYIFDPSLPSLFVITGSINPASGGIFSPDTCFVMNNASANTFSSTSSGCMAKKHMNLMDTDGSLVGYWDMETLTGGLLRDLSGNGNNLIASGTVLPTSTGGFLGKAYSFPGSGTGSSLNWGIFYTSGSLAYKGSQEITAEIIVKTTSTCPEDSAIDGPLYAQVLLESSVNFNTNTGSYIISDWDYSNDKFIGCRGGGSVHINTIGEKNNYFITRALSRSISDSWKILTLRTSYSKTGQKEVGFYINGIKQEPDNTHPFRETLNEAFRDYPIFIGSRSAGAWSANGTIDDIKIYNRALSEAEIKQHAKIAGF